MYDLPPGNGSRWNVRITFHLGIQGRQSDEEETHGRAGVLITGGGPKISNCFFQDNNVRGYGAGLYAQGSTAATSECTFYDNIAWTDTNGSGRLPKPAAMTSSMPAATWPRPTANLRG